MDEQLHNPREEISYIKTILEKTADGMKSVAPWFVRVGIFWLVYGILQVMQRLLSPTLSLPAIQTLTGVLGIIGWIFYISLAVSFFMRRRNLSGKGGNTLGLKLMDIWGICILLFLFLTVILTVILSGLAAHIFSFSEELTNRFQGTLSICHSFLIFVLPLLPLLSTAVFLDNRRMLWTGIVLTVLAAAILSIHAFLVVGSGHADIPFSVAVATAYNVIVCLLDIAPGLMLLYFGQALKRE